MRREWHKWYSGALGRDMELLTFAADGEPRGLPVVVFPTSCGRFWQWEEMGMLDALGQHLYEGRVQLFCVDSVDAESWYNRDVPGRWRIARHMQYERYVTEEVLPLVWSRASGQRVVAAGASMGAYHAADFALRRPDLWGGLLAMSGIYEPARFLGGYWDEDVYFHSPVRYLPGLDDAWHHQHYRQGRYVLAAGEHDICRGYTEEMAAVMGSKGLPVQHDVWGDQALHDWPVWRRMVECYL